LRIERLAEQAGLPIAGRQQARQHLHGGGLAAAVRTQETEDLAAADAEVDMVAAATNARRGEAGPRSRPRRRAWIARRDLDGVIGVARSGQQGDESRLK
jgi:hypothetical protein